MKPLDAMVWIITLFLLGSIGVLIIMNPKGFNTSAGTIFSGFNTWATTLSGSGYKGATGKAGG
jgi:hypothetical protein